MSTNRMRCGVTAAVVLMTGFDLLATPLELGFDATTVVTGREASVGFALHELNEIVTKSAGRGFEVGLGRGQRSRSTAEG